MSLTNVGVQMAVGGVSSKISNASADIFGDKRGPERDSISESQDGEAQDEPEPLISWQDFLSDPCLFLPIIVLQIACWFGFAMLLVNVVGGGSTAVDLIVGLVLLGVGFFAAFEIRMLGSMSDQIKHLQVIREHLEADTAKLSVEVEGFSAENQELEDNVSNFREQNDDLAKKVDHFDKKNSELRELHAHLEEQNTQLKTETQAIMVQNDKLKDTVSQMSDKHDQLTDSLAAFDDLRNNLSMMAENSGEQMADLIQASMSTFSRMDEMILQNEDVILNQLAADVEGIDGELGMSEREFKRFVARLPRRYKTHVKEQGITFQTFDTNGDGNIHPDELRGLIKTLIAECNQE